MSYSNAVFYLDYTTTGSGDAARANLAPTAYASNGGPNLVRVTVSANTLVSGAVVTIAGTTGAIYNGTWMITVINTTTFDLQGSTYSSNPAAKGTCVPFGGDSWANAWQTITSGATAARIAPGDTIRIAKSPDPTVKPAVNIVDSTDASPISIHAIAHGLTSNDSAIIAGHTVNVAANGTWVVTVTDVDNFTLNTSVGSGAGPGGATGTSTQVGIGRATWNNNSKTVTLAAAQTATVDRCETAWTASIGIISVLASAPTNGGTGYTLNDILTITTGGTQGTCQVTGVLAGVVTAVIRLNSGSGYTTGTGKATTGGTGGGDCTVNITTVSTAVVTKTAVATDGKEGSYCMKVGTPATAYNYIGAKLGYLAISPGDLSAYQNLSFWIKNDTVIPANAWKICLCSDASGETPVDTFLIPAITSTFVWLPLNISKNGGGNLGASTASIALYASTVTPGNAATLKLDDIIACTSTGLNLQSLISKNTLAQSTLASTGYGNEGWYAIQSIVGTIVLLDNGPQTLGGAGRGYSGTTETVNTFIRETIKTTLGTASGTVIQAIQDSGDPVLGNISFLGGYNTGYTNQQDGETFFDGLNGYGYGIDWETISYVTLGYLAMYRYYDGFYMVGNTNLTITFLSNISNNGNVGLTSSSTANYNNTITTLLNVNNNTSYGFVINSTDQNNTVTNLVNVNNNQNISLYIMGSFNKLINVSNANNNAPSYGIYLTGSNNTIGSLTTASNVTAGVYNSSLNYIGKWTDGEAVGASGATSFANNKLYVTKYGATYAKVFTDGGYIVSQASTLTHGSGTEWLMATQTNTNRQSNYPLTLTIAKIAVNSGSLVTVSCWFKKGHNTNIAAALVCRSGQLNGVAPTNVVCPSDTNENQLTMTFTPTETGILEIEAWAWYVAGHSTVIVDAMTVTQV